MDDPVRAAAAGAARRAEPVRIIGGRFKGRTLSGPLDARAIRPTSDRLRETIFNILDHAWADPVTGARVIDLFAGTGALGLEALSRGASHALFVDDGPEARALLRANVQDLGVAGISRVFRRDATRLGEAPPGPRFGVAFLDPPYGRGLADAALKALAEGDWLQPQAICVVEEAVGAPFAAPPGYAELDRREQRDSVLRILRYGPASA